MTIRSADGRVSVHPGHAPAPDLVLTGPADLTIGLLAHRFAITGDARLLRRLRPNRSRTTPGDRK